MKIIECKKQHIDQVVNIHYLELKNAVLNYFGKPFLQKMYLNILKNNWGFVATSNDEKEIYGFIFSVDEELSLVKCLSLRVVIIFGISILKNLKRAKVFFLTFKFYYSSADIKNYPFQNRKIELAHFAVSERFQSAGIGKNLIEHFEKRAKKEGVSSVFTRTNNYRLVKYYIQNKKAKTLMKINLSTHSMTTLAWKI